MEPDVQEVAALRADTALIARRRASLGVADVVLGIAWAVVLQRLELAPGPGIALAVASQALVGWGFIECLRAWRDAGGAGRLVAGLAVGVALVELVAAVAIVVTGGGA